MGLVCRMICFTNFVGPSSGRYTGEVNENKMPHGVGEITYDHGLVQEGKWVSFLFIHRNFKPPVSSFLVRVCRPMAYWRRNQ